MMICETISETRLRVADARKEGQRIACVPTMGALHQGHLSLIRLAREHADFVIATVFVNPTQFAPQEDLDDYPRPFEEDCQLAKSSGADLLFHPDRATMYRAGASTFVEVSGLSSVLEGEHRPAHFRGVATVVMKLLNITQPEIAVFGQKDYQQQLVIRKMCADLDLPVEIIVGETIREDSGLAMSSRNRYLSDRETDSALSLSCSLFFARDRIAAGDTDLAALSRSMREQMEQAGAIVDYAVIADADTLIVLDEPAGRMVALVAARVGETRLIDNLPMET